MTATPRTNGAKKMARTALRPQNFLLSATASASGTTMSSGTHSTVKIAVARIEFRTAPAVVDPGGEQVDVVLQAHERLARQQEVPLVQADPEAEDDRREHEQGEQHQVGREEQVGRL